MICRIMGKVPLDGGICKPQLDEIVAFLPSITKFLKMS